MFAQHHFSCCFNDPEQGLLERSRARITCLNRQFSFEMPTVTMCENTRKEGRTPVPSVRQSDYLWGDRVGGELVCQEVGILFQDIWAVMLLSLPKKN